jgi:hypothetical protein
MAVTNERATDTAEIWRLTIDFADAELEDLRARIVTRRWPEAETVADACTEKAYPSLIYYNELDNGGHFAAWEQPQLFSQEVARAFGRSAR